MFAALILLQRIFCRASIEAWSVYQRFCVFRPSVSRMMICCTSGSLTGAFSGCPFDNACHAQASPIAWLVLPLGVIWSTFALSALQSLLRPNIATGQASYCSAGKSVDAELAGRFLSPAFGAVLVVS